MPKVTARVGCGARPKPSLSVLDACRVPSSGPRLTTFRLRVASFGCELRPDSSVVPGQTSFGPQPTQTLVPGQDARPNGRGRSGRARSRRGGAGAFTCFAWSKTLQLVADAVFSCRTLFLCVAGHGSSFGCGGLQEWWFGVARHPSLVLRDILPLCCGT